MKPDAILGMNVVSLEEVIIHALPGYTHINLVVKVIVIMRFPAHVITHVMELVLLDALLVNLQKFLENYVNRTKLVVHIKTIVIILVQELVLSIAISQRRTSHPSLPLNLNL